MTEPPKNQNALYHAAVAAGELADLALELNVLAAVMMAEA